MIWILYLLYAELKYFLLERWNPFQVGGGGVDGDDGGR
jgi:hypothetical protein